MPRIKIQPMPAIPSCSYGKVDGKVVPWNWHKAIILKTDACAKTLGLKHDEPWLHTAIMVARPVMTLLQPDAAIAPIGKAMPTALVTFVWDTREVIDIKYVDDKMASQLGQLGIAFFQPTPAFANLQHAKDNGQPIKTDVKAIINTLLSKVDPDWLKEGYGTKD